MEKKRRKVERNGEIAVSKTEKQQEELDGDIIVWEILSRLPVKSLMRFKCVCKSWQSVIPKDRSFIDLHLSRSIETATTRCTSILFLGIVGRMYLLSADLLLPSDEEDGCVHVSNVCVWDPPIPNEHSALVDVCTLGGLICFMDKKSSCARVYNSSTRESTPWIKSVIKQQEQELNFIRHELGYDPATKEYKVLALWASSLGHIGSYGHENVVCEVLTVGQNLWRRIDGFPPISFFNIMSVYVNVSVYLRCKEDDYPPTQMTVEFNVGSEKFSIVERRAARGPYPSLMDFNGRLCVLDYDTHDDTSISMKMRILCDHGEDVQDKKSKMTTTNSSSTAMSSGSAAGGCNYHWVEETLSFPNPTDLWSAGQIPGTNLFVMRSDDGFSFYHYNQEKKCCSKINSESSTSLRDENGQHRFYFQFKTFTPNLLPVN